MLAGTNVALGVSGSIAAVKTVELAHELRRQGAEVRAVMTDAARGIVHPWSLEFATENPVITEITGSVEHVELCGYEGARNGEYDRKGRRCDRRYPRHDDGDDGARGGCPDRRRAGDA